MLLHAVGDFERIADHSINIVESAEELKEKKIEFTIAAKEELRVLMMAVSEIMNLAADAFVNGNMRSAALVEPLEQVVDNLKERLRNSHITRMQSGECTIEAGFVWADLLNDLERVADHCSNIAGCVCEMRRDSFELHSYTDRVKTSGVDFDEQYREFALKYAIDIKK